jgi:hypothetical protein
VCLEYFKTFNVLNASEPSYLCLQNIVCAQIELKQMQIKVCLNCTRNMCTT